MKKEQIINTIKDQKFIVGVVSTLSVFILGSFIINAFNPNHRFNMMEQNRFGGRRQELSSKNHMYREPNIDDIYNNYQEDDVDLNMGADAAKKDSDLTVEDMLTYAIQDEYMAQATYDYIISEFGNNRPFSNIINSEANHIELLKPLLEKYASIPTNNAKDIILNFETIQEAYKAGVAAEIDNIKMYETFLSKELPDDVKVVFTELLNASKNHLQAFSRKISRY